ncbi:von Willebrand factor type A domain-containing protein [Microdochium trichocladiopsis]|uniref:von Willebrand factor type A domain-containing protein n=1 Tax=Microdochium trichocladiopsis TaxID=1682393 RepID=A0A9P9BSG9_9PEZI|nr:von Willebrand factor type A domain-containing protein [Microdochium trichocladiopsis]KAH7033718.1 von Willebrand factor type A domain-containing protein [Microdochium trichocladiopsis]
MLHSSRRRRHLYGTGVEQVFQFGIQWDHREPLPLELADHSPAGRHEDKGLTRNVFPAVTAYAASAWPTRELASPAPVSPGPPRGPVPTSPIPSAPQTRHLAPLLVSVKGQVIQDLALVTVSQTFENQTEGVIPEARYTFPLPDTCTVTGFSCRIGASKTLRAKVKPKAEARHVFDKAKQDDRFAGLLEEQATEIFTAFLGNVPSHTRVKTEISYTVALKTVFSAERTAHRFLLPTDIAPRYGAPPTAELGSGTSGGRGHESERFTLDLEVLDAQNTTITSSTHVIKVELHQDTESAQSLEELAGGSGSLDTSERSSKGIARIKLRDGATFCDVDLKIDIFRTPVLESAQPRAWLEKHPTLSDQYAMMIDLPRPDLAALNSAPARQGEVIFLADRSGSMEDKIDSLRLALRFFLKGIPASGWTFNIWSFGTTSRSMWPQSRVYDAQSLAEALDYLDRGFEADLGGTELLPALEQVVASRSTADRTRPCEVIIITDGEVWRLQDTLDYVEHVRRSTQHTMRFFALGIGQHVSAALVNGIAHCGGGYAEIIPQARDGHVWQDQAVTMLKTALSAPSRQKLLVEMNGIDCNAQAQSPQDLTVSSSPFETQRVFMLFTSTSGTAGIENIKVTLQLESDASQRHILTIPTTSAPTEPGSLHTLAARACLADHKTSVAPSTRSTSFPTMTAEGLAIRFSLLSKWTSLVLEAEKPDRPGAVVALSAFNGDGAPVDAAEEGPASSECTLFAARGLATRPPRPVNRGLNRTFWSHDVDILKSSDCRYLDSSDLFGLSNSIPDDDASGNYPDLQLSVASHKPPRGRSLPSPLPDGLNVLDAPLPAKFDLADERHLMSLTHSNGEDTDDEAETTQETLSMMMRHTPEQNLQQQSAQRASTPSPGEPAKTLERPSGQWKSRDARASRLEDSRRLFSGTTHPGTYGAPVNDHTASIPPPCASSRVFEYLSRARPASFSPASSWLRGRESDSTAAMAPAQPSNSLESYGSDIVVGRTRPSDGSRVIPLIMAMQNFDGSFRPEVVIHLGKGAEDAGAELEAYVLAECAKSVEPAAAGAVSMSREEARQLAASVDARRSGKGLCT